MTLNYYNVFYHVAIAKNITNAAKELNISQPSVSRTISMLEYEIGEKLFERTKNGVRLTQKGETLFHYVSQAIALIKKGENKVMDGKYNRETLSVGASQLTVKTILPNVLRKYEEKYPDVNLVLTTNSSSKNLSALKENLLDIAVIPDPVEYDPDIETLKVMSFGSILIAGKKYESLKNRIFSLKDLVDYPLITLSNGTAGRRWLDKIFLSHSLSYCPSIEVPTSDIIPHLVKNDLGLGLVAEIFTHDALAEGSIIKLEMNETLPERNFLVCFNKKRTYNDARENFIELITSMSPLFFEEEKKKV